MCVLFMVADLMNSNVSDDENKLNDLLQLTKSSQRNISLITDVINSNQYQVID